jgi:hypothetical protein
MIVSGIVILTGTYLRENNKNVFSIVVAHDNEEPAKLNRDVALRAV